MILITGSIVERTDTFDALLKESLAHVHRSRAEPGCIAHNVHVDCEHPLRLVFVEKWHDKAAVAAHFKVKGSADFVRAARTLADAPPVIEIFDTTAVEMA
jgi:quinol monooxygenase YgiN